MILLLCVVAYFAIQHPAVQSWLTKQAAAWLSKELGTTVRVGAVDIDLWARAVLEDVYVEDLHHDTLVFIPSLHIGRYSLDSKKRVVDISSIQLDDPVIRLARYEDEEGMNFSFIVDYITGNDTISKDSSYTLQFGEIKINDGKFRYDNMKRPPRAPFGIDWNRMNISGLNLEVENFASIGDSVHAEILELSALEKSGFNLVALTATLNATPGNIRLTDTRLATPTSELKGDLAFTFESVEDWDDFENKVSMDHLFAESKLCACDLAWFAPEFKGLDKTIDMSGHVKGKIAQLKGKDIYVKWDTHSFFRGDISLDGLPEIDQTFIELDVQELSSNKLEIDRLPLPPFDSIPQRFVHSPPNFAPLGQISFSGNFTGFINDFVAYGMLRTALGNLKSDIALREVQETGDYVYTGNLHPSAFHFGKFYGKNDFGLLTADLRVEGSGLRVESVDANIEGMIEEFQYKNYSYRNALVRGNYKSRSFNGDLSINDEFVDLDFHGEVNFAQKEPVFNFEADIYNLDLKKLNLYPNVDYSGISGYIKLDSCIGLTPETFRGEVVLRDVTYCTLDNEYFVDSARVFSSFQGANRLIEIYSPFGQGTLSGNFDFRAMEKSFGEVVSSIIPSYKPPPGSHPPQDFTLDLQEIDVRQITEIFYPEIKIAPHTRLYVRMNEPGNYFEIRLHSDSVTAYNQRVEGLTLDAKRPDTAFNFNIITDRLWLEGFEIVDFAADNVAMGDSIRTDIVWGNTTSLHGGELAGSFNIRGNRNFDFRFDESNFRINNKTWYFNPSALVQVDSTHIELHDFTVQHETQIIKIDGAIAETSRPQLDIVVSAFQMENLNFLLEKSKLKVSGVMSGAASIRDFYGEPIFSSDITLLNFILNEYEIGNLAMVSTWNNTQRILQVNGKLERNDITPLSFAGEYRPNDEISPLDIMLNARDFELDFLNSFMTAGTIELSGKVTGDIAITGTPEAPQVQGRAVPKDVSLYVNYINTRYFVMEEIGLEPDMFTFDHIRCSDQEGHLGYMTGTIAHNNFSEWNFDMTIEMEEEKFLCMDTQANETSLYYGKAYCTGYLNIFGYANNLEFDINLKSESGSVLVLPLGNKGEVVFEDFVRFVDSDLPPVDDSLVDLTGIKLNFNLEITSDLYFEIVFDRAVGDVIGGRGVGNINMDINQFGDFSMYGLIEVVQGNYLFTLKNLVNKEFKDARGTIAWYGNPYQADIDLRTTYKVSASLYEIMPEENERFRQRVPVNLVLHLQGKLLAPNINFDIELPTVDQITRGRVESAISSEEEKNRQAFALLVLQRFVSPPNVTKEYSGGIGIAENSSELLSSQLSNWLSQISDDFNLGFNYRPGDEISNDEIALALSTQLFNERLQVIGNFGVSRGSGTNQNPSTLIGDLRLEYKLTPEGKIRLMVYNQSNDFDIATTRQSPYTQGLGLIYEEEFDTAEQFFCQFGNLLRRKNGRKECL